MSSTWAMNRCPYCHSEERQVKTRLTPAEIQCEGWKNLIGGKAASGIAIVIVEQAAEHLAATESRIM